MSRYFHSATAPKKGRPNQGKTHRSLPKHKFPRSFHVTFTPNHWSNTEKSVEYFKHIIFPYLEKVKEETGYPEEQKSLVIMDTFKGQDNNVLKTPCEENHCVVVLVPNKLTNKFRWTNQRRNLYPTN